MNKAKNNYQILVFASVVFLPVFIFMIFVMRGIFFYVTTFFKNPSNEILQGLGPLMVGVGIIAYFIFVIDACYKKYTLATKFLNRLFVMLIGWIILLFPLIFVVLQSIGGVSMAVAEGVAGNYMSRLSDYVLNSLFVTMVISIGAIPWLICSNWIINKFNTKRC